MLFITTNDLDAFIRATTVDNDVFEIRILLIEYRQNRLFEELSLIVGRCDNAELWRHDLECAERFGKRRPLVAALHIYAPRALNEVSYQSIVFRSPSSSDVCARKPNFSNARVVSSWRRGCPSGLSDCHLISP